MAESEGRKPRLTLSWFAGLGLGLGLMAAGAASAAPQLSAEERAAAFPELPAGMDHMREPWVDGSLMAEHLEWQARDGSNALAWDLIGWVGTDEHRLWLRDEGEHRSGGARVENRLELHYGRPVAAWWDAVAGVRVDTGHGATRRYLAIGLQGLAPQWFHVEATGYLGKGGQLGLRVEGEYEWLFTNRLILALRAEAETWKDDDPQAGIGSGVGEVSAGLRLRYEWRRELAPYIGVEWASLHGDSADLARAEGERVHDRRLVLGLRAWF